MFWSEDNLPLSKTFNFLEVIIVVACVLEKNGKCHPHIFFYLNAHIRHKNITVQKKLIFSEGIGISKTSLSKEWMLCRYWYFKVIGSKVEPNVSNECHDLLMTAYEIENIAILNVKGVDFRCILWSITRDEPVKKLNSSMLQDKGVL